MPSLQEYFDFAVETAYLAGRLTLAYFQTGVPAEIKSDNSPVTVADRLAEELVRSRIEKSYPQHAIIGEEHGVKESTGSSHRWFIDPIDGTKSFLRGVPLYGVLIGLEIDGIVEVGAAYFPPLDEMVAAASGLGCWWNGRRVHVSKVNKLHQAYFCCTDAASFRKNGRAEVYDRVAKAVYFRPGWGDAYGYACVATGRAEIMMDPVMNVWDCGPFPPIFRETGGYFGDWQGNETIYSCEALATNQALLPEILEIINS